MTELHVAYYGERWTLGSRFESDIAAGVAEFVARYDNRRDGLWTVVDEDDRVVGGICVDGRSPEPGGAQIRYFVLDRDLHGNGFGRELLERAMAFCHERAFDRVFLWTVDGLDAAIHLYRDVGFEPTGELDVHTTWQTAVPYRLFEYRP